MYTLKLLGHSTGVEWSNAQPAKDINGCHKWIPKQNKKQKPCLGCARTNTWFMSSKE